MSLPPIIAPLLIHSYHNTYLTNVNGGIGGSKEGNANATWTIENFGNRVAIRSHEGTYLRADNNGKVNTALTVKDWELWSLENHPTVPNTFAIRSHHNNFLRCGSNAKVDLVSKPQEWESWKLFAQDDTFAPPPPLQPVHRANIPVGIVVLNSRHDSFLGVSNDGSCVYAALYSLDTWKMTLVGESGSVVTFRSLNGGLLASNDRGMLSTVSGEFSETAMWTVMVHPTVPGNFAFRSNFGLYLRCDNSYLAAHVNAVPRVQEWEAWGISVLIPFGRSIMLESAHTTFLQSDRGRVRAGTVTKDPMLSHWTVEPRGEWFAIRAFDGGFLSASSTTTVGSSLVVSKSELWDIAVNPKETGKILIKSCSNGAYLRCDNTTWVTHAIVNLSPTALEWESWVVVPTQGIQ